MTVTGNAAAQILMQRGEAIAAIEQRDLLRTNTRRAVITALNDRLICRAGADDALSTWDMAPLPCLWTVHGTLRVTYSRMHDSEEDARHHVEQSIDDELWPVFGRAVWVRAVRSADVTLIRGEDDQPESHPYRITAEVSVALRLKAGTEAEAIDGVPSMLASYSQALADRNLELSVYEHQHTEDEPDYIGVDPDVDAPRTFRVVRLPDDHGDLDEATRTCGRAHADLDQQRRDIRARAIEALNADELGVEHDVAAERIEGFLIGLGLSPLPVAHHILITADLQLHVRADTGTEARRIVWERLRPATSGPRADRRWTAVAWCLPETTRVDEGLWAVTWRYTYDLWLRGHNHAGSAADTAEAMAREHLAAVELGDLLVQIMTIDRVVAPLGVDLFLDPATD